MSSVPDHLKLWFKKACLSLSNQKYEQGCHTKFKLTQAITTHNDYQVFSATNAQLNSLKNNFKFALKLTLKSFYMFLCKTPSSGSTLSEPC